MSDAVAEKKLVVIDTIKDGFIIGIKNIGPILVNVLLWAVTVWIPYLNVGTTIGLSVGIVTKAARGEMIPLTEIFDPKYRRYMGEYFLTVGLVGIGVTAGTVFGIIPGIVISLAWCLSILLVVDKGKNPTEALVLSNNCTYGYKWKMVGIYFLTGLMLGLITMILTLIGVYVESDVVHFILYLLLFCLMIFWIFIFIGLQASIYKQLCNEV
jgi:hypothetical protein